MDLRCIICDYNLRGLDRSGNCPECGSPITRSLHGDLLRHADQQWLAAVHRGAQLVSISIISLAGALLAVLVAATLFGLIGHFANHNARWLMAVIGVPAGLVFTCAPIIMMFGLWMITTPEPRTEFQSTVRPLVLRIASMAVVPAIALLITTEAAWFSGALPMWAALMLPWVWFTIIIVQMIMFIDLLQSLDGRCAAKDEKRRALLAKYRSQSIGCVVVLLIIAGFSLIMMLGPGGAFGSALNIVILISLAIMTFSRGTAKRIAVERAAAASAGVEEEQYSLSS